jgi:crossover junction endodeoxyribonuclease RuvC
MAKVRILGIDPGSLITGYGIIDIDGNHATHVAHGTIRLKDKDIAEKLKTLFRQLSSIIETHQPDEASIEKVFFHKNADSALKLGQARGCTIAACAELDLPVFEYTANQVKQATVGRGHAAKQQVQHMTKVLLCLNKEPQADAADALAIALCHGHSREGLLRMSGVTGIKGGRLQ